MRLRFYVDLPFRPLTRVLVCIVQRMITSDRPDPSEIEAVVFDAGGVLLLPDIAAGRDALASFSCKFGTEEWERAFYRGSAFVDQVEEVHWPLVRREIAAALGVDDGRLDEAVPIVERLILEMPWTAVPGAAEVLNALSASGFLLAVVSNAGGTVESELAAVGVCSVDDDAVPRVGIVVDSHHVGVEKPDPRIFEFALESLGIEASRAIYIGDTVRFDVLGAEAAGIHPVHMDPFNLCRGEHAHIRRLGDLTEWCAGP